MTRSINYQLEQDISKSGQVGEETLRDAFDTTLHYLVRDDLLSQNNLGEKYKLYYYFFSDVYIEGIGLSLAIQTMETLAQVNDQLRKIQDQEGQFDNEIFLNETLMYNVITVMDAYKLIYSDYYTDLIMEDFKNDLENMMYNKTIAEVRTILQE